MAVPRGSQKRSRKREHVPRRGAITWGLLKRSKKKGPAVDGLWRGMEGARKVAAKVLGLGCLELESSVVPTVVGSFTDDHTRHEMDGRARCASAWPSRSLGAVGCNCADGWGVVPGTLPRITCRRTCTCSRVREIRRGAAAGRKQPLLDVI